MPTDKKPLIAVTATILPASGSSPNLAVRANYVDAVAKAGGVPVVVPPAADPAEAIRYAESFDAFVFVGGPDIDPARFGEQKHPLTEQMPARREEFDFALVDAVIRLRKPFLGICLGCQEVNVALGGTLIQDVPDQTGSKVQHSREDGDDPPRHMVAVEPDSIVARLAGSVRVKANSSHHQAVREPGAGLRVVARCEEDGIIEALELEGNPFGLAIQWHPEYLTDEPEHMALFRGLVEAATK